MKVIKFRWVGVAPLLMQSDVLADPLGPTAKALRPFTSKRGPNKTDADHEAIAQIEFGASIYHDAQLGPYMPALNIDVCVWQGGKMRKSGAAIKRGFMTFEDRVPLRYEGPRDLDCLYGDRRFVDRRAVVIGGKKTIRTRPTFREWSIEFDAAYDEDVLNFETVTACADLAGRYCGIGTYRPRFGRFRS